MQHRSENGHPFEPLPTASSEPAPVAAEQHVQLTQTALQEVCDLLDATGWVFALDGDPVAPELDQVAVWPGASGLGDAEARALGWHVVECLDLSPQPVVMHELADWLPSDSPARSVAEAHRLHAWAVVPLLVDEQIVGVVVAARAGVWRPRALRVLSIVARQVAANLESARLYQEAHQILRQARARNQTLQTTMRERRHLELELLQRNRELAAINRLAEALNGSLDLDVMLSIAIDSVVELVAGDVVTIRLVEDDVLRLAAWHGLSEELVREWTTIRAGERLVGEVAQRGEPLVVEDYRNDPRADPRFVSATGAVSAALVPFWSRGHVVGVMAVCSRQRRQFTVHDMRTLMAIANPVGAAIERSRLYQAERERAQSLEELNQLKSTFVSTVSHELRTPMAIVKGSLDALATNWSSLSEERRRSYLAVGRQGATRLKRLLDDLLLVARIEDGLLSLRPEPVSVAAVAHDVVEDLRYQYPLRAVQLDFPTRLPLVLADRSALWEVLLNLIDNALKYSPDGTKVQIGACMHGDELVLTVSDQGIGIPETAFPRLFARFERIDQTVRSRLGTGLGLYICKQLIEAMGGRIWVESTLGQGSTFLVALPVASDE